MDKQSIEKITLDWLKNVKASLLDENASWVGVYWLESFIDQTKNTSTDLVLGPYIGFDTPHTRISIQKGVCGRAIRENRTLNIPDVNAAPEYLSCSIETKSEIVIPILDSNQKPIGELDIDNKKLNAFSKDLEQKLIDSVKLFEKQLHKLI